MHLIVILKGLCRENLVLEGLCHEDQSQKDLIMVPMYLTVSGQKRKRGRRR